MAAEPQVQPDTFAAAVTEVSDRVAVLVREEIELATAEITVKMKRIAVGAGIAAAAGIFVLAALLFGLHGFAWLLYYELPIGNNFTYFWGFFVLAVILLVLAVIAGLLASRLFKRFAPPTPQMAIDEAKLIRETVTKGTESV